MRALKRALSSAVTFFSGGAQSELLFRKEFEFLLPSGFKIVKASRYTENDRVFSGVNRLPRSPTDYAVIYKDRIIAAIEVTTGARGWSYNNSKVLIIDEEKLERMDRYGEGYVVMRILQGEPHFIWALREDIRGFEGPAHCTDIKIWKCGLNSLIDALITLAKT
jgi:hypothetical protein